MWTLQDFYFETMSYNWSNLYFGSVGLDSSMASIFHVYYSWYNFKQCLILLDIYVHYLNLILSWNEKVKVFADFLISYSLLCALQRLNICCHTTCGCHQLSQKLGCTEFLVFAIEEPAVLSKGMQECNRNVGKVIATLACT